MIHLNNNRVQNSKCGFVNATDIHDWLPNRDCVKNKVHMYRRLIAFS